MCRTGHDLAWRATRRAGGSFEEASDRITPAKGLPHGTTRPPCDLGCPTTLRHTERRTSAPPVLRASPPAVASAGQRRRRVADPARRARRGRQDARGGWLGPTADRARGEARRSHLDPGGQQLASRPAEVPPRRCRARRRRGGSPPRDRGRRAPASGGVAPRHRRTPQRGPSDDEAAAAQPLGPSVVADGARAARALHDRARRPAPAGRGRVRGAHHRPCPHRRTRSHRLDHRTGPGLVCGCRPHGSCRGLVPRSGRGRPALHAGRRPGGGPGRQRGVRLPEATRAAPVAVHRERGDRHAGDRDPPVPRLDRRRGPRPTWRPRGCWSRGWARTSPGRRRPVPHPPAHGRGGTPTHRDAAAWTSPEPRRPSSEPCAWTSPAETPIWPSGAWWAWTLPDAAAELLAVDGHTLLMRGEFTAIQAFARRLSAGHRRAPGDLVHPGDRALVQQ